MMSSHDCDYLVIGGGFYGCCLALFLRSLGEKVIVVEAEDDILTRASRVNQARIHTGFHYPRSALTAIKSLALHQRFARDFPEAVVSDFGMLYAVASRRSKVSAKRFYRMFRDMGAPISPANATQSALFDLGTVEQAFACSEYAFDYTALRSSIRKRLGRNGVEVRINTSVDRLTVSGNMVCAGLSNGDELSARYAFNITYARINDVLRMAELPRAALKHELAEIAIVEPPEELRGLGVTVMDGPFFSCMPYPSEQAYSLTHVRYTPHESWLDRENDPKRQSFGSAEMARCRSRVRYMTADASRFMPCLARAKHSKSLFEIKTVLLKNEQDDGRPILYQRKPADSRIISILGGKIDNIYDLFDLVVQMAPEFAQANDNLVTGREAR